MTLDELRQSVSAAMPELHSQFGVKAIFVFGSVARGQQKPGSDVDLIVDFDELPGLFGLLALRARLKQLLHTEVDVGTWEGLRPRMLQTIRTEAVRVA